MTDSTRHRDLDKQRLHDSFHFVQSDDPETTDPAILAAGMMWLDTTSEPYLQKRRNAINDGWINVGEGGTGDFMSDGSVAMSDDLDLGGNKAINAADPVDPQDLVTKAFLEALIAGLDAKDSVAYCSTSALPSNTYANGSSGVGATLTGTANGFLVMDGVTFAVLGYTGLRVLVAGESAQANNGWYRVTDVGSLTTHYVLTRDPLDDQAAEIGSGYITAVSAPTGLTLGSANNGKAFISAGPSPFVVGTSALIFSSAGSVYAAGSGLTLTGVTFSVNVDGTTIEISSGNLRLKDTAVTPGSYGDGSNVPVITVNAKGQITSISTTGVVGGGGSISDAAYGSGWNGDTTNAPSKNAVYDKIETLGSGSTPPALNVYMHDNLR